MAKFMVLLHSTPALWGAYLPLATGDGIAGSGRLALQRYRLAIAEHPQVQQGWGAQVGIPGVQTGPGSAAETAWLLGMTCAEEEGTVTAAAPAPARTTRAAKMRIASFMVIISLDMGRFGINPLL